MSHPALPRRPRPGAWAVVLGLHLLLLGLLLRLGTWSDRGGPTPARPPALLWLLGPEPPPRAKAEAPPPPRPSPRAAAPPRAPASPAPPVLPAGPAEPQAITLPPSPAPAPAPEAAASEPARPLDLALPRAAKAPWRQRNPALDDPRGQTPRATLESRLAGAMGGSGEWVEERVDLDHVRFRRGNRCVNLQRSRSAQIDPMARNAASLPWLTRGEEPC